MHCVDNNVGEIFFLDAPGGTGKTFAIKVILASIQSKNDIALAIVSSGIAARLLPGGRTAHSALKLPLNLHSAETPTRNISKSSGMGKVLQQCKLIILGRVHNGTQKIARGSGSMFERFAREFETLWQHINIALGRFQANITYNT